MGKASRKLKEALKNTEDLDNISSIKINVNNERELYDEKIHNITLLIYAQLIKYTKEEGFPLCELLDITNIENYIRWIMAYYR